MAGGRPTLYRDEYPEQAYKLCLLMGATDADMADFFEVSQSTLNLWKIEHPKFSESIKKGKATADMHLASKLFNKAEGAEWEEEQAIKVKISQYEEKIEVVKIKRAAPPDTTALIFWLKNRQPKQWRDRQEVSGPDGGPILQRIERVIVDPQNRDSAGIPAATKAE